MSRPLLKHYGKIVNGIKKYYNAELYKANLKELEGEEFEETIKKKHKTNSLDQNGFYRAGIIRTCLQYEMFFHMSEDEVHDFFGTMFLGWNKTLIVNGKNYLLRKITSTTDLSREEMQEYIEKCIHWCAEQNIIIQDPQQYELGKYKTIEK